MSLDLIASWIAIAAFSAAMIYSAARDVVTMTVSDRLLILLLVLFPVLAPLAGWPAGAMASSLLAALVAFAIGFALFALGWMGGGDGKLISVAVLWLGAGQALDFALATVLLGGACAALLLAFRRIGLPGSWLRQAWIARLHAPATGIPYAVAIGIAGLLVLPESPWTADYL